MRICIITPVPPRSRRGNRITALRWSRILRDLGHRVTIEQQHAPRGCDMMIALHARRSGRSIEEFARVHPERPLIVALTGTDLYGDIHRHPVAQRSLELAWRLIVLQPLGVRELAPRLRDKVRVIHQSVASIKGLFRPKKEIFEVCVLGHLREVKDPFRIVEALRILPAESPIRVVHVGAALDEEMGERAQVEAAADPRYRWLGEQPRWKALRILARCRLLVLSSKMEGGANAICEAIALSVPIISSKISGSIGLLGEDYPAYFPVGDSEALADLLIRSQADEGFYRSCQQWCARLAPIVDPAAEKRAWAELVGELERLTKPAVTSPGGRSNTSSSG